MQNGAQPDSPKAVCACASADSSGPFASRVLLSGLGLGCVLSLVLCLMRRFDAGLAGLGFDQLSKVVYAFLILCAVVGAVALVAHGRLCRKSGRGSVLVGSLLTVAASLLLLLYSLGLTISDLLLVASGCLYGAGVTLLSCEWFAAMTKAEPIEAVFSTATALIFAGVVQGAFKVFFAAWLGAAALLVLSVLSGVFFPASADRGADGLSACGQIASPDYSAEGARLLLAMSDVSSRVLDAPAGKPRARDVAALSWISLAGLAFCAFITGLTWDPVLSDETSWRSPLAEVPGVVLGALVAGLIFFFLGARHGIAGRLGLLTRAVQPVSIALVLVVPIVKQWISGEPVAIFSTVFSALGFALLTGVALVELVVAARVACIDARRFAAGTVVLCALAGLLGLASIEFLGTGGRTLCFVLEAAFFTAVAVSYALRSRVPESLRADEAPAADLVPSHDDERDLEARCRLVAAKHGLSPRELDVLLYIGRGYGSSYIAPQLGISENTVRTHVRHIYEKVGVSSRQGLIAYVDGIAG